MKVTEIKCDINGCGNNVEDENVDKEMDVIFTTEQTEGRSREPYLSRVDIDICGSCLDTILSGGIYIKAAGAMGHNKYTI